MRAEPGRTREKGGGGGGTKERNITIHMAIIDKTKTELTISYSN